MCALDTAAIEGKTKKFARETPLGKQGKKQGLLLP